MRLRVKYVAVAMAAFFVVSAAVGMLFRTFVPDRFTFSATVQQAAEDTEINVVFLGTSRIKFGAIPDVFDRTMHNAGMTGIRAYNAAEGGDSVLEAFANAEALFGIRPRGIKFVFIEPDLTSRLIIQESDSTRAIEFFTLPHALLAIRFMNFPMRSPPPAMPTIDYVGNIAAATFRHYFRIGLMWAKPEPADDSFSAASRGFPDLDERVRQSMPADEQYLASVRAIGTRPHPELISDDQLNLILSLASFIAAKGAIPILIRPPQLAHWDFADAVTAKFDQRCAGKAPLFFNFSSPEEYGELYDPRNRMNSDHLNASGAAIFSTLIAERLARAIHDGMTFLPLCG